MADNNLAPKPESDDEQNYGWQPEVFEGSDQSNRTPQGSLHAVESDHTPQSVNDNDPEKKFGVVDGDGQSTPQKQDHLKSVDGLEGQGEGASKSLYTGSDGTSKQPIRARLKGVVRKKNLIGGGIIGALIGGGIFGFTFLSGPLQFVHIAQLLSGFHFETIENVTNDRASRLWRYARHHAISDADGTNPKRRYRRLGEVGNIFANGVETRLSDRGITAEYNTRSNFDGYTFDPNTYEDGRYKGNPDALRAHLESRGIAAEVYNGSVRAPAGRGFFSNKQLISTVAAEAGYGKVLSKVSSRVLRTRGAVFFHPIRRADEAFKGGAAEWWQRRRQRINDGDTGVDARAHNYETEDDFNNRNNTDPDVERPTPTNVDVDGDTIEQVRSSGGLKSAAIRGGGAATAAAAVTCVAYGVSSNYDALADENVNKPLTRLGMEYTSLGGQVKSGQDFSIEQLGPYADPLYNEETETSWVSAASIQHELGEPVTGPDIPDSARPSTENNPVSGFLSDIGGVSEFCKALGSPAGQLATLAMDIAAGPFSLALAGADLATNASGKALDFITNWIARDPVDIEKLSGAELGGALNYGVRLAANDQFIAQGGQELTATQTAKLDALNHSIEQNERSRIAFSDRLFNITDARSLVSKLSYNVPRSFDASVYYALNNVSLANLFSSPAKLLMSEAYAQDTYSYGFNEYGFSEDELNDPRVQNPYENFEKLAEEHDLSDLSDEYGDECFGVKVDDEGNVTQLEGGVNPNSMPDKCASDSEELLRFRFFLLDMGVANAGACYYGDEQACQAIGVGGGAVAGDAQQSGSNGQIVGDPNAPSASIPCAAGTKDLGTSTSAYSDGQEIPTRLCEITEFANIGQSGDPGYVTGSTGGVIVNSRVSGAWLALYEAAEADGVELIARSSFRTMEHQEEAWVDNGMNTALVARPGYSKHQTGHAIDFANVGGAKVGASCLTRNHQTGSEMWVWLEENARDYGFKVYSVEPWHWDALDAVNRC